jgi:lipid A 3-O-deacylase
VGGAIRVRATSQLAASGARDRPYAGWGYLGASLLHESGGRMLENFEIDLGVVGPLALGDPAQLTRHRIIGDASAKGWGYQLHDEPGAMISCERFWRRPVLGDGGRRVDVVPQIGATVGSVMTDGRGPAR